MQCQRPDEHRVFDDFDCFKCIYERNLEWKLSLCNPVEKMLFEVMPYQMMIDCQVDVTVRGQHYRLDFYDSATNCAIEVDGLAFHNGQDAFTRDRRRQANLEMSGMRVLRFTAKDVMDDALACAELIKEWLDAVLRLQPKHNCSYMDTAIHATLTSGEEPPNA